MTNNLDLDRNALEQSDLGPTCLSLHLNSSVMLGNLLQQTTSADVIFRMNFFLAL